MKSRIEIGLSVLMDKNVDQSLVDAIFERGINLLTENPIDGSVVDRFYVAGGLKDADRPSYTAKMVTNQKNLC